ncbi:acetolactate synthase large subunit [Dermatophilus congolensis]|uniref:acetolactate synthase large subunit n=1 Tax=Dermatophilus congolensis TaxID=1863 RepID=UPI000429C301|nr:acetolactate synthase large subunit [Dermatophilus congolensis]
MANSRAPRPSPPKTAKNAELRNTTSEVHAVTGAESLVKSLEAVGADVIFGMPGDAIWPAYEPLLSSASLRHILVRHEQAAGHAAQGYACVTGKVGVCMATSGPGATNLVTAIADAHMDSVPLVAITGQVASSAIGTDAFQEADIRGITMPITKHNFLVTNPDDIPAVIASAFHIASTGRPGPVLIDITKDAQRAHTEFSWPPKIDLPGYKPGTKPHQRQIREAAKLIGSAQRPVFYFGGGAIRAGAGHHLRRLIDLTRIPCVTTLMGRGVVPDSHPLHLGMPGMHGCAAAVMALQKCDLLIAIGARFDDCVTGKPSTFAPAATVIHADIDAAEIGKNRAADVPIVGDAKAVTIELLSALGHEGALGDYIPWREEIHQIAQQYPLGYSATEGQLAAQFILERLSTLVGPEATYVSGVGQHQMWAAQFITYERPASWLNSGGLGTMGYAVPAAMGAKVAEPDRTVWAIDGDGCFQMTNQELATCLVNNIPIKVAILNNSSLGMLSTRQGLIYGQHAASEAGAVRVPDFVKLAEAYGCAGFRCEHPSEVDATIAAAMAINDRPAVIDFVVAHQAMQWPMVPAEITDEELRYVRESSPVWDRLA